MSVAATRTSGNDDNSPSENPAPSGVPAKLPDGRFPRGVIVLIGIAAAWFAIVAMQGLKDIIAPVFFALNLMIVVYPIKTWLSRHKVPEWLGSVVCGLVGFLVLVAFFASLGWALAVLVQELPNYNSQFTQLYQESLRELSRFGVSQDQLSNAFKTFDPSSLIGYLGTAFSSLSGGVSLLVVALTTMVFLIMDAMDFEARLPIIAEYHPNLVGALQEFAGGTRKYWVVCTSFGLLVAVLDLIVLLFFKVPLPFPWFVLAFLTNYIPSIGFVIGLVPPALMALLAKGPVTMLIVIILYMVLNFVAQSIIQPKVAGDALGVTPTVTFLSLLFWAWVLGPLGAILALPATLFIKAVFIDADPHARWLNGFIAAKPESPSQGEDIEEQADPNAVPQPDVDPADADELRHGSTRRGRGDSAASSGGAHRTEPR